MIITIESEHDNHIVDELRFKALEEVVKLSHHVSEQEMSKFLLQLGWKLSVEIKLFNNHAMISSKPKE